MYWLLALVCLAQRRVDSRRIVGGHLVQKAQYYNEFNFYVGILDNRKPGGTWDQFSCSGVLISKKHVLTAGHCVLPDMDIIGGTPDLSDDAVPAGRGHRIHVKKAYQHPDFVRKELWHDVAVLELEEEIPDDHAMSVIARANASSPVLRDGDMLTVVGWGDTDPSKINAYPYNLMFSEVPALKDAECDSILRTAGYGSLDHREKHCAGGENKDTCQGDSGGPAFRNGVLYGTVSWGASCHGYLPAVYSDTMAYEKFINDAMESKEWPKESSLHGPPEKTRGARALAAAIVSSDVSNQDNGKPIGNSKEPWPKRHWPAFVAILVCAILVVMGTFFWLWCYCSKVGDSDSEASWTPADKIDEPLYASPQQDQISSQDEEKENAPLQRV